uniref:Uncharacterized protein n=1 Tax=Sphaerodactylus townsendi TaxID=933632 RepID=A0ACB8ELD8_9SAUR
MTIKVVALGLCFGEKAYLKSSWNMLDGVLVLISAIDILVSMVSDSGTKILGMLRVLRLLRTLRPLRHENCINIEAEEMTKRFNVQTVCTLRQDIQV